MQAVKTENISARKHCILSILMTCIYHSIHIVNRQAIYKLYIYIYIEIICISDIAFFVFPGKFPGCKNPRIAVQYPGIYSGTAAWRII